MLWAWFCLLIFSCETLHVGDQSEPSQEHPRVFCPPAAPWATEMREFPEKWQIPARFFFSKDVHFAFKNPPEGCSLVLRPVLLSYALTIGPSHFLECGMRATLFGEISAIQSPPSPSQLPEALLCAREVAQDAVTLGFPVAQRSLEPGPALVPPVRSSDADPRGHNGRLPVQAAQVVCTRVCGVSVWCLCIYVWCVWHVSGLYTGCCDMHVCVMVCVVCVLCVWYGVWCVYCVCLWYGAWCVCAMCVVVCIWNVCCVCTMCCVCCVHMYVLCVYVMRV